ncbi:MAG: S1 RNA-binding domain-containing protein [Leadbetterella sp.]|nr:S1 RNA-binding domain-containing protein [Leadbetterella sp.]
MSFQSRNEVFSGLISGVTDFGLFVELDGMGAEGMVRLADLNDDYYEYDPENYRVTGRKSGRVISFGQAVKVKVKATDIERRSIELELLSIEGKALRKSSPSRRPAPGGRKVIPPGKRRRR